MVRRVVAETGLSFSFIVYAVRKTWVLRKARTEQNSGGGGGGGGGIRSVDH